MTEIPAQELPIFQYFLSVEQKGKTDYRYKLIKDGEIIYRNNSKTRPGQLNTNSSLVKELIKELEGNVTITVDDVTQVVSRPNISKKLMACLENIENALEQYILNKNRNQHEQELKEQKERLEKLETRAGDFCNFIETKEADITTFLYYAAEWLSGGEARNTLVGVICHLSTYFHIKPIWFFSMGKAGEGKSVIEECAHEIMPPEAFRNGRISESALHRKTETEGIDYLDGKIMRMKDMGGKSDYEKWADTLDRYKELTTEGIVEVEKTSDTANPDTGRREVDFFQVRGYCSACITSVDSEGLDDQILSRGIDVTPEATNEQVQKFFKYNQGLIKEERARIINDEIGMFHDYVNYVEARSREVEIINPYDPCLYDWFEEAEYYKRGLSTFPALVKTVTLLNYDYRQRIQRDGKTYLISTRADNQLIADLFNPGHGVSKSSIKVFNHMTNWFEPYRPSEEDYASEFERYERGEIPNIKQCKEIFNVSIVKSKVNKNSNLKGLPVGEIIGSLTNHGFIEPIGKMPRGNKNVYALVQTEPIKSNPILFESAVIEEYVGELSLMYGVPYTPLLEMVNQENTENDGEPCNTQLELPPWSSEVPHKCLKGARRYHVGTAKTG